MIAVMTSLHVTNCSVISVLPCRPLPAVVVPCLGNPLGTILGHLKAVFPPAVACLAAQGSSSGPGGSLASSGTGLSADLVFEDDDDEEDDEGGTAYHVHRASQPTDRLPAVMLCITSCHLTLQGRLKYASCKACNLHLTVA